MIIHIRGVPLIPAMGLMWLNAMLQIDRRNQRLRKPFYGASSVKFENAAVARLHVATSYPHPETVGAACDLCNPTKLLESGLTDKSLGNNNGLTFVKLEKPQFYRHRLRECGLLAQDKK